MKRLLNVWDQKGTISRPTPWQLGGGSGGGGSGGSGGGGVGGGDDRRWRQ
jgi:hypothetical protein